MPHLVIGAPYRHITHLKKGEPVYQNTTIVQIHADHLVLANGAKIDFVRVAPSS